MVTFKLVEEIDEQLVFWYYPEGHEDKRHGVIVVDRIKEEIDITELAEVDWERDIEAKVLEELSAGHEAELINIEEQLKELQDKVVKNVNNNDEFDSLVDKIEQLINQKEELTREQVQDHRNAECVTELEEAIETGKDEAFAYSDKLVRDFIEKIEVFPDYLEIQLKAGMRTTVFNNRSKGKPSMEAFLTFW